MNTKGYLGGFGGRAVNMINDMYKILTKLIKMEKINKNGSIIEYNGNLYLK